MLCRITTAARQRHVNVVVWALAVEKPAHEIIAFVKVLAIEIIFFRCCFVLFLPTVRRKHNWRPNKWMKSGKIKFNFGDMKFHWIETVRTLSRNYGFDIKIKFIIIVCRCMHSIFQKSKHVFSCSFVSAFSIYFVKWMNLLKCKMWSNFPVDVVVNSFIHFSFAQWLCLCFNASNWTYFKLTCLVVCCKSQTSFDQIHSFFFLIRHRCR